MVQKTKSRAYLLAELDELRQRIADLERSDGAHVLINTTVDSVISVDSDMKVTLWNPASERMFGYSSKEMLGQSLMKIVPRRFHTAKEKGFAKFQNAGSGPALSKTLELEGRRKDGTSFPIELTISSSKVGTKHIATAIIRDITQRKQAEEVLQENKREYKSLSQNIPGMIHRSGSDWRPRILLNSEEICGYSPEEFLSGKVSWIDLIHPEDKEPVLKDASRILEKPLSITQEYRITAKDGSIRWIEDHKTSSITKAGILEGIDGIAFDKTKQMKTNEKLKKRTFDLGKRVKELNCFYELEKISRTEKITIEKLLKSAARLLPPSWQYPDITGGCIAFGGKKYKTKNFKRTKWMQSADIVVDEKKAGCIEICYLEEKPGMDEGPFLRDERRLIVAVASRIGRIIERKQKEEALKESEERLSILFEYAPDAFYLFDLKGNFIDGNKAAEKLTGFKKKELIGKNFLKLKFLPPEQMPKAAAFFAKSLIGKATGPNEFVLIRKDGTRVYVEISTNTVKVKGRTVVLAIARDISKIKQAENKLKLERVYIDQLFENTQEAIVIADKNGHVMRANDEFIRLFGFSSHDEIVGTSVDNLVVPDDAFEIAKSITNKVRMGDRISFETVRLKKDGSLVDVSVLASPIEIDGKLLGTFGIYRDITDRKQAEKDLKESEARYKALFEASADGIIIADMEDRQFKFVNPAMCKMFGYSEKEFMKLGVKDIHPQEDLEHVNSEFEAQAKGEKTLAQNLPCLRKDGTIVHTDISSTACVIDGKKCMVGFFRDISERERAKKVETALYKISEATTLTRNIDDLFSSIHRIVAELMPAENFYIAIYNSQNDTVSFPYFVDENEESLPSRKGGKGLTEYVIRTGKPTLAPFEKFKELEKKGEVELIGDPWVYWLGIPLKIKEKTIGVLALKSYSGDIRYGEHDKNILMFVSTQVAMAIERKQADERLMASLKEKEVLLREIHHRVKNNLQIISSLLLLQSKDISGKKNLKLFQESQNRVKSMALIHEKLYQSQDLASVNFKEYLNTLIIGLFRSYQSHSSHVELKLNIDDISLGIDNAIPCGLIINELISNSLKYAFPNGREGVISVALRSLNKKDVELVVSDNGIGMPEDLDFRNTKSLGLHLVTILAEDQLEGEIKLSRDKGTEFRIKLRGVK